MQSGPVRTPLGKNAIVSVRIRIDIHGIVILDEPASVSATVIITFRGGFRPNLLLKRKTLNWHSSTH